MAHPTLTRDEFRLYTAIQKLQDATLSELTRKSQLMRAAERHTTLGRLEALGLVESYDDLHDFGPGRPSTRYKIAASAPAA